MVLHSMGTAMGDVRKIKGTEAERNRLVGSAVFGESADGVVSYV